MGPGGVGKTRLAVRIATDLARGFADGAWLVELADIRDAALVPNSVMAALDLRDQASTEPSTLLLSYLRDKELLLVLDNCEHLLGAAAAVVTEIMRAAPGVRVIATTREQLSVAGEQVVPVPPLDLPAHHGTQPLAHVRDNEAVTLFTQRAAEATGRFELTESNQAAVVDICRRLDGIPLAIELAAVRTRVLSPEQILDRLDDRFGLLTGGSRAALPRHQTLQTTIDWSYDLLAATEQALMRRLCVFAGRFTLEDVEAVCTFEDSQAADVLDLLSSLVEKSLVIKEDARSRACYRLHETMREYAALKLRGADELTPIELRFVNHYVSTCQAAAFRARYGLFEWLEWMDLEIDNVRWVLRRCLAEGDIPSGVALAASVSWYWITRATTEGVRWLDELLASGVGSPGTHAWAYFIRGFLAVLQSDPAAARPALQRAVAWARESGQTVALSHSLSMASIAENMAGDHASARRLLDEAQRVTAGLEDVSAEVGLLQARAFDGLFEGDLEAVRSAASEGVRLSRESGDLYSLEMMLMNLGLTALISGELDDSRPLFAEALRIAQKIDDRLAQYALLDALSYDAVRRGEAAQAAQLLGAAETVRNGAGATVIAFLVPLLAHIHEAAVAAIGEAKFKVELDRGRALSRNAAIVLALGDTARAAVATAPADAAGPLGKREAEVAKLVSEGLSNREIGTRLFISERTVDSHVRHILDKLGFNSRSQIAAWMASAQG